ncbi:MAG: hypothetical protein WAU70_01835 [Flavobacteriales bacterium]
MNTSTLIQAAMLVCAWPLVGAAQNLVPNGSFEDYTDCPDYWNQVTNAIGWSVCSPSPDYFNACRDSTDFGVPVNWLGQQAASEGDAYVGLAPFAYNDPEYREIVCAELSQPLEVGVPIFLSFKVALGGYGSLSFQSPRWTAKGVGLYLSTQPIEWPMAAYPNAATIYLDYVLTDTTSWVTVEDVYVPDSEYTHVAIGNFFEDSLSEPTLMDSSAGLNGAYVFIDDVCIALEPWGCNAGTGLESRLRPSEWGVQSPFADHLLLWFDNIQRHHGQVTIQDTRGRAVAAKEIAPGINSLSFETSGLADGVYILTVKYPLEGPDSRVVVHLSP